eukprot:scaffold290499_cov19-Prasinocladus_malaysianus.AAC.2
MGGASLEAEDLACLAQYIETTEAKHSSYYLPLTSLVISFETLADKCDNSCQICTCGDMCDILSAISDS